MAGNPPQEAVLMAQAPASEPTLMFHVPHGQIVTEPAPAQEKKRCHRRKHDFHWLDYRGILMTSVLEGVASYAFLFISLLVSSTTAYGFSTIGIVNGLAYAAISFLTGALINPMFSLTKVVAWRMSVLFFLAHIVSQFIGALLAAVTLRWLPGVHIDLAVPELAASVPQWAGLILEFIGGYILGLLILVAVYRGWNASRAFLIGLGYGAVIVALGPLTSGCLNPYRALAASLFTYFNSECWVYYVAWLISAVLAGIMTLILHLDHVHEKLPDGEMETRKSK